MRIAANIGDANLANTGDANNANNANTGGANNANNITPAQLRTLLVQSGKATQAEVDQIDDATLMDVYKEALAKQPQTAQTGQTPQTTPNTQTIGDPASLTIAEIKQLLIDEGMDEATLGKVDDATLRSMYLEALKKVQDSQAAAQTKK